MDSRTIVNNIKQVLFENSAKYSDVWLSFIDFGGLYHSNEDFILNVEVTHPVQSEILEIKELYRVLKSRTGDELSHIWGVNVFQKSDRATLRKRTEGLY
jgi:hypothetical protein